MLKRLISTSSFIIYQNFCYQMRNKTSQFLNRDLISATFHRNNNLLHEIMTN
jgi:hypothetical protein